MYCWLVVLFAMLWFKTRVGLFSASNLLLIPELLAHEKAALYSRYKSIENHRHSDH